MAIKRSSALHLVTAVVTIILLMAFTVFSVGIFAEDEPESFAESQPEQDVTSPKEIHYFQSLEWIHSLEENGDDFYIVVFDVGTTGTRAHVFHFGKSQNGNGPIILSDDVFESPVTLTSTIVDPQKAAEQCLSGLVEHVTTTLPKSALATTKVLLKATENLRKLPEADRQRLVKAAYDYLQASPLLVEAFDDTFGILDSQQEGFYQWITINYVNGMLTSTDSTTQETCGVIGIGGGSVQITFQPKDPQTIKETALSNELKDVHVFRHSVQLYTHSYSGLGRAESRLGIFQTEDRIRDGLLEYSELSTVVADVLGNSRQENDINKNADTLYSVCLPPGYRDEFSSGNSIYDVASATLPRPHSVHDICSVIATVFLDLAEASPIQQFSEVNTKDFYVLEKTLRHLVQMRDDSDGSISLKEINTAAKQVCKHPDISEPFACIDLIYTYTLLHHGFGFTPDAVLHIDMPVRLDGALSWALGFVVDWLQNHTPS